MSACPYFRSYDRAPACTRGCRGFECRHREEEARAATARRTIVTLWDGHRNYRAEIEPLPADHQGPAITIRGLGLYRVVRELGPSDEPAHWATQRCPWDDWRPARDLA